MSRHFEASTNDELQVAAGALSDADGGPFTGIVVFRLDTVSVFQRLMRARTSGGAEVWAIAIDSGQIYVATTAGFRACVSGLLANTWYMYVATKANGSAIIRDHLLNMNTGVWTHANRGAALGDGTGTVDNVLFSDSGARVDGYIAAAAVGEFVPSSDAAVEAYSTGIAPWLAAGVSSLWRFNDSPVNDLTGNGSNQNAIVGTTVDTGVEPPSFSYSLGGQIQTGALALFL